MRATFYLETYGCALNMSDSDILVARLQSIGIERTDSFEDADVIIVNTCGVKEPTEDKIIFRLSELSKQSIPLVVTGCLPKISFDRVKSVLPSFAAILGPRSIDSLGGIIDRVLKGERGIIQLEFDEKSKLCFFQGPPESVICTVPICEGCLGNCAYCAVRFAREEVWSYKIAEIVKVVKDCVSSGYLEIRLTSQDAGVFGHDTDERLVDLLNQLSMIDGTHKYRLGMFNPNLVLDYLHELLESINSDRFFKFFHVPLQSGSDRVLARMKRRYKVKDWLYVVDTIRDYFPKATIATDIIVGYPDESNNDFQLTLDCIRSARPSIVNISKYGDRPGTLASKSRMKVDTLVKKDRSRELTKLVNKISREWNESWSGWQGQVIVTDIAPRGGYLCRNYAYRPVIVHGDFTIGQTLDVRIHSAARTHLLAKTIP